MRQPVPVFAILMLATACGGSKDDSTAKEMAAAQPADSMPVPAASAAAPANTVTDPQIAAIVVAANDVDVAAGHLAVKRAKNADVKAFGQQMIVDHSAVNKAATDLVTKLNVTPEPNPTSEQLTQGGQQSQQALEAKHGDAFDQAYIANEVAYHQAVLDAIDNTLIPNAQNAELKALLEQTRPAVAAHLDHAKTIQASLTH